MADLNAFAELIRKGKEDKLKKEVQEQERKKAEFVPLLSELFSTVSKAKVVEQKRQNVVSKVDELESKIITQDEVTELVSEKLDLLANTSEKKLVQIVQKLQDDILNLKKQISTKSTSNIFAGAGSGEVRVLRMDDVDKSGLADGAVMTYSATLNKLVFTMPNSAGSTTITDEEMPYAKRIDFVTDNELYKAEADVGSAESSPVWRIRKVIIAGDNDVSETWANGTSTYDKIWTNRFSYSYL